MKRAVDVLASVILGILFLPIFSLLIVMVRLKLGAPVFFIQERVGLNGAIFKLIKFRTMDEIKVNQDGPLPDELRLTAFGHFLRKTSLDELPQLWNVFKGEMSFVGPRPLLVEYLPLYTVEQARRHTVRPGITGWAQVNGRNALGWEDRFRMDVWYVDNACLLVDIKIIWLTLGAILTRNGVNAPGASTMPKFVRTDHPED